MFPDVPHIATKHRLLEIQLEISLPCLFTWLETPVLCVNIALLIKERVFYYMVNVISLNLTIARHSVLCRFCQNIWSKRKNDLINSRVTYNVNRIIDYSLGCNVWTPCGLQPTLLLPLSS